MPHRPPIAARLRQGAARAWKHVAQAAIAASGPGVIAALLLSAGMGLSVYAVLLLTSPGWAMLAGSAWLIVCGVVLLRGA